MHDLSKPKTTHKHTHREGEREGEIEALVSALVEPRERNSSSSSRPRECILAKMTDLGSAAAAAYPSPSNYSSPPAQKLSPGSWDRVAAMSMSPEAYGSKSPQPSGSGGGYGSSSGQDKSPLSTLNIGFLKALTEKRTTRGKQDPSRP